MDFKELQDFIKTIAKSGATEVKIETDNLKLTVKAPPRGKAAQALTETTLIQQYPMGAQLATMPPIHMAPSMQTTPPYTTNIAETDTKKEESNNYIQIKAPMVGTFYRKPSPDKSTYVSVGDEIEPGKIVCIIEAMKLFNEIEAEISGKIVKVLVDDATPVEFDQPLFLVDPN
ncbi:MAG: acetyl-CoA carboxylase biotin carboxyl carrier protein [Bacteroidales bacterium]|nr:acetyl-CoA carboxylase biotin carboxyl carrier protein [Bacteroidales bacterium]MBN2756698.1 acetyl-CoA carboxylase biotin carboxyl carrier protein [Bacteroidales bacterium]